MLALGVAATVAANVAYGVAFGALGAVISAWPAVAFIGTAEMAMGLVRRARTGNPLSQNALQARFRLTRAQAAKVRREVLAGANGHAPPG